jgi:hypothetical protein
MEPGLIQVLKNDSIGKSVRRSLEMTGKYTDAHGIRMALDASFLEETKTNGLFFKMIEDYLFVLCFFGESDKIEEMCVFDFLKEGTYYAKCLKEKGVYKRRILKFADEVISNY